MNRPVDWEACYACADTPWDKGSPAPGLTDFLQAQTGHRRGRVLVPGCGLGHDAKEWARHGFQVTGLDLSPTAVRQASRSSREGKVLFQAGDFLQQPVAQPFDWMFEHTLFCAIQPELRGAYVEAAARAVRPGGHLLAIHYLNPKDPAGPPFGVAREEVVKRFGESFNLLAEWVPRSFPGRENRERLFWWKRHGKPSRK